ncbi:MAG: RlmE family RNA methyltransferase [Spirochaetaceae bacterium]|nr:RlmE family RNA methyltransferase [Spirochaetaceae bacterium]
MSNYEKPDFWALKARKEGYPARSVYKLLEIDGKFGLLPKGNKAGFKILELGASPGSWSLYILRKLSGSGFLAACDLSSLSSRFEAEFRAEKNFFFKQADMFAAGTQAELAGLGPFNLILSDAAPLTSGERGLDAARSHELAEAACLYARSALKKGGNLCVKIFQGAETAGLIKKMRPAFNALKTFKPEACRSSSFETYLVGLGFKILS